MIIIHGARVPGYPCPAGTQVGTHRYGGRTIFMRATLAYGQCG